MQYDPIKRKLGAFFNQSVFLRKLFYRLLDLLLLRAWHVHRELKLFAEEIQPKNILDAGAGFGQYTFYMSKLFPESNILSLDVKEEQVNDCNVFFSKLKLDKVRFEIGDLITYVNPNTFDLVLCVDVMEHIEPDRQVLKNYCDSMKKGGMLLISTPSDKGGSDVHDDSDASFIEEHVRDGYNLEEMKEKILNAGFSKTELSYSYGVPGKLSWKLSMKYPLLMLNKSKLFFILIPFYYLITFPISFILNWLDVRGNHKAGTGLIAKAWK